MFSKISKPESQFSSDKRIEKIKMPEKDIQIEINEMDRTLKTLDDANKRTDSNVEDFANQQPQIRTIRTFVEPFS